MVCKNCKGNGEIWSDTEMCYACAYLSLKSQLSQARKESKKFEDFYNRHEEEKPLDGDCQVCDYESFQRKIEALTQKMKDLTSLLRVVYDCLLAEGSSQLFGKYAHEIKEALKDTEK